MRASNYRLIPRHGLQTGRIQLRQYRAAGTALQSNRGAALSPQLDLDRVELWLAANQRVRRARARGLRHRDADPGSRGDQRRGRNAGLLPSGSRLQLAYSSGKVLGQIPSDFGQATGDQHCRQRGQGKQAQHRGDRYLRKQLVHGARAVIYRSTRKEDRLMLWVRQLVQRVGANKASVALANRLARLAWIVLQRRVEYQPQSVN